MTATFGVEPAQIRSRRQNVIIENVKKTLSSYGYLLITTPIYEQYDLLKETAYDFNDESIIRFLDRNTGKSLVLRPDFTPQVARIVTGYMADYPLPLRLYYSGEVFRSVVMDGGHKSEEYQIGWELIGGAELCGDLEMFTLTEAALSSIGLADYNIVLGDSAFLSRILDKSGKYENGLQKAISEKKLCEIEKICTQADFDADFKRLLLKLPLAFGAISEGEKLKEYVTFDKILSARLDYIFNVINILKSSGMDVSKILFDPSETMGLGYYTGLNFKVVHPKSGSRLGSGGRYDNLMAKFGKTISACGMALKVDELMRFDVCKYESVNFDYLCLGEENFAKALELRKNGFSVFFLADRSKKDDFLRTYKFNNVLGVDK